MSNPYELPNCAVDCEAVCKLSTAGFCPRPTLEKRLEAMRMLVQIDDEEYRREEATASKHKTAELEGALLDAAVAKALGEPDWARGGFSPSSRWHDAGPIIEREQIVLVPPWDATAGHWARDWLAWTEIDCTGGSGHTPLVAAMRAYVHAKFGSEVELP